MTVDDAVNALDALDGDAEVDHGAAEDVLLSVLDALGAREVREAFERARERVGFWYA